MKKIQKLKNVMIIPLTEEEINTKMDRLVHAENLIRQFKFTHRGRNTWLKMYGVSREANKLRELEKLNKASFK